MRRVRLLFRDSHQQSRFHPNSCGVLYSFISAFISAVFQKSPNCRTVVYLLISDKEPRHGELIYPSTYAKALAKAEFEFILWNVPLGKRSVDSVTTLGGINSRGMCSQ